MYGVGEVHQISLGFGKMLQWLTLVDLEKVV